VDIAAEQAILAVLTERFPGHGFYAEESGSRQLEAEYLWLIDPIDGTKSFVRGSPLFSIQIALMHRQRVIMGLSSAPCWNDLRGELAYAERGRGAWVDGRRVSVARTAALHQATLSTGNLNALAASSAWARFGGLIPTLHRLRGYGDFLHYHWLAEGKLDAVVESNVNILDIAALSLIVEEAGGVFTDLSGAPLSLATTSVLAAVPALHPLLREAIGFAAACT
jgi:histidinol-phosphatase